MTVEIKHTNVNRDASMDTQQLINHLKAIGQAIIDDAEKIAFDASDLASVGIDAYIAPCTRFTTVEYRLRRIAQRKEDHGRTEEAKDTD